MDREIDYGALFGLEGVEEPEVAAPAEAEGGAQGAEEQEVAVPAVDEGEAGDGAEGGSDGRKETKMTARDARYAAARRKAEAERDAAIARARKDAQKDAAEYLNSAIRALGLSDPYAGKPITTKEELDAYNARKQADLQAQAQKKSGLTEAQFAEMINNHPTVRAANEAKARAEEESRKAQMEQARVRVAEQLEEIGRLDPNVRELSDLTKMENYETFYGYVRKGLTLAEAFKLANMDRLTQTAAEAGKQAARNAAGTKGHMQPTAARGEGMTPVPAEVLREYCRYNPRATKAEIQRHWQKMQKK